MHKTKNILKIYFEKRFSKEIQMLFIFWLTRKSGDPEMDEALEELWNDMDVPADIPAHRELNAVKEKLNILQPSAKPIRRLRGIRTAAYISAACVAGLTLALLLVSRSVSTDLDRENVFARIDAIDIDSVRATTIIAGDIETTAEDDEPIRQTETGGIIINEINEFDFTDAGSEMVQVVVPKGKRSRLRFNDKTLVWINSGTKLLYPKTFGEKKREIFIDGEIYLEVAEDADRPFVVNTKNMNVKVLGTQFNIRSYSEEAEQSVVLIEGEVEVRSGDNKSKETLLPNQGIFFGDGEIVKKDVNASDYIGWKSGELRLGGESLRTIFDRLSKHYNIDMEYDASVVSGTGKYRGKLLLGDSLEDVLTAISLKVDFTFDNKGNTIYIREK